MHSQNSRSDILTEPLSTRSTPTNLDTILSIYSQNSRCDTLKELLESIYSQHSRSIYRTLDSIDSQNSGSNIVTELDAAHSTHANQATNQPGSQQNHQPAKQPTTQPTPASNRLFGVWCLLSAVVCLLSICCCLFFVVLWLLSFVRCLLFAVCSLLSVVSFVCIPTELSIL